jgi:hypothetical protein
MAKDSDGRAKILARLRQRIARLEELLAHADPARRGEGAAPEPSVSALPVVEAARATSRSRRLRPPRRASA